MLLYRVRSRLPVPAFGAQMLCRLCPMSVLLLFNIESNFMFDLKLSSPQKPSVFGITDVESTLTTDPWSENLY